MNDLISGKYVLDIKPQYSGRQLLKIEMKLNDSIGDVCVGIVAVVVCLRRN